MTMTSNIFQILRKARYVFVYDFFFFLYIFKVRILMESYEFQPIYVNKNYLALKMFNSLRPEKTRTIKICIEVTIDVNGFQFEFIKTYLTELRFESFFICIDLSLGTDIN